MRDWAANENMQSFYFWVPAELLGRYYLVLVTPHFSFSKHALTSLLLTSQSLIEPHLCHLKDGPRSGIVWCWVAEGWGTGSPASLLPMATATAAPLEISPAWMMPRSRLAVGLVTKFILSWFVSSQIVKNCNWLKHCPFVKLMNLKNFLVFACCFFGFCVRFLWDSVRIPKMVLSRRRLGAGVQGPTAEPGDAGVGPALAFSLWWKSRRSWSQPQISFLWKSNGKIPPMGDAACPRGAATVSWGAAGTAASLFGGSHSYPWHLAKQSTNPFFLNFFLEFCAPNQLDLVKGFHRSTSQVIYSRVL